MRNDLQIKFLLDELRQDPYSRRGVVALWQPESDSGYTGKDMPCNCTIFFKVREGKLNLTVANRSNDMVWGAYGANVVQFSTILEYVAGMLGVQVGRYTQVSDSFHVYVNEPSWQRLAAIEGIHVQDPYEDEGVLPWKMVTVPEIFDEELWHFVGAAQHAMGLPGYMQVQGYENNYFDEVARPLFNAFKLYKEEKNFELAINASYQCNAADWARAAREWLLRRWNAKTQKAAQ